MKYDAMMALGYLGDQLNWQEVKTEFEWDGSLRDLYILDTDVEIWQRMLNVLRASGYPLHYTVDGEQIELPIDVGVIFNKRLEGNSILSIEVQDININCHFFTQEQIEFDIDPREINTQTQFGHLCAFMRRLGNSLGRSVILTPEISGSENENVIIRYSLVGDRFI